MSKKQIHSVEHLRNMKPDQQILDQVSKRYAIGITDHVRNTIHGDVKNDPVAKQYIPQLDELKILPIENLDPIADYPHTPIKGIVHRHSNRVLFKLANVCAVYCRFCFRREMVGQRGEKRADILTANERSDAINYIRTHPEIEEVIFTGGDPLVVSARQLKSVMDELCAINHVQILRFHTRVPIADPARITPKLLEVLNAVDHPLYMTLHINHAQEITPGVTRALTDLHNAGCVLLSQSVLLKDVNDDASTLADLTRALIKLRVKPYYIHHPDLAPGTSHFRLPITRGMQIMKDLRSMVTGMAIPHYMLDIPGGHGKVPLNESYVEDLGNGQYLIEDPNGQTHHYPPEAP